MESLAKSIVSLFAWIIIILGAAIILLGIIVWIFNHPGFPIFFAINAVIIGLIVTLAHFFGPTDPMDGDRS